MDELREKLAALCHEQWSGWMKYLFSKSNELQGGVVAIPQWEADRWKRQMNTPYGDLTAEERDSDRAEANKIIASLPNELAMTAARDKLIALIVEKRRCSACPFDGKCSCNNSAECEDAIKRWSENKPPLLDELAAKNKEQ